SYQAEQRKSLQEALQGYDALIPLAEHAKFEAPRNKYLFLAYRGMGYCSLALRDYERAEQSFVKALEFAPVWPGLDDSAYPAVLTAVGVVRIRRENWNGAAEVLEKAATVYEKEVAAIPADSRGSVDEGALHFRALEDSVWTYLALAYSGEGKNHEALVLMEKAYTQAMKYDAPQKLVKDIVNAGFMISLTAGDVAANSEWLERRKKLP